MGDGAEREGGTQSGPERELGGRRVQSDVSGGCLMKRKSSSAMEPEPR